MSPRLKGGYVMCNEQLSPQLPTPPLVTKNYVMTATTIMKLITARKFSKLSSKLISRQRHKLNTPKHVTF